MKQLREYQKKLSIDAVDILKRKSIVCLFMEVFLYIKIFFVYLFIGVDAEIKIL